MTASSVIALGLVTTSCVSVCVLETFFKNHPCVRTPPPPHYLSISTVGKQCYLPVAPSNGSLIHKLRLSIHLLLNLSNPNLPISTQHLFNPSAYLHSRTLLVLWRTLYISSSICQHIYQYVSQFHRSSVHQNVKLSICPSICQSSQPATRPSINPYIYTHQLIHPLTYSYLHLKALSICPHD